MEDERGQREILFRILRQEMKTGLEEMQTGTAIKIKIYHGLCCRRLRLTDEWKYPK